MCRVQDSVPNADISSATSSASWNFNHSDLGTIPAISLLTDDQKYQILSIVPATLKEYPVNNQKQRFQLCWVQQFPWVRYSKTWDGVFCTPCFLFSLARFNNEFVSSPFHNRKNADGTSCGKLNRHVVSQCHIEKDVILMEKASS